MRNFIYCLYISLALIIFNPHTVKADELSIPMDEFGNILNNIDENTPLIETDNEFVKLYVVYKLIDKLYKDDKIKEDITPFLARVWPTVKYEKLKNVAPYFKIAVSAKRRYTYVTDKLKQKIKALTTLPEDAPIIAKDGEYAPLLTDELKQTAETEYKVSYIPYKYLEYDQGELGEPVRRRDKNYETPSETAITELTLGLLEFDIPKIINAIKKMPKFNDGTREKEVDLGEGVQSRLMLATSGLGRKERINGVLQIKLPKGWYINGDFLNPRVKPHFFLSEDENEDLNIKEYQVYYPEAIGVKNNNHMHRILVGTVNFPITFTRRDTEKGIYIKGDFSFMMCEGRTNKCHPMISRNSLKIAPSETEANSMHSNYVEKNFARLPHDESRHAKLKEAYYNKETKELYLKFAVSKTFSNVAAMAEDAAQTDFQSPQFNITENEITATFKVSENQENSISENQISINNGGEIAITAAFDNHESLRTVITPEIFYENNETLPPSSPDYKTALWFGLILNLMPGLLYIMQRLLWLLISKEKYKLIFTRYAIGTLCGLIFLNLYTIYEPWYKAYENIWLTTFIFILVSSYLMHLFGYMDFSLFRPFKKRIRQGYFLGFLSVLLMLAFPMPYKAEVLNNISSVTEYESVLLYLSIWLGMLIIPGLMLINRYNLIEAPQKLTFLNRIYNLIYLLILLWIAYSVRGSVILIILIVTGASVTLLWYVFPSAVLETTKHVRAKKDKQDLFDIVQKQATIVLCIIFIISATTGNLISKKYTLLPPIEENRLKTNEELNHYKGVFIMLSQDWSWHTLLNYYLSFGLEEKGIKVIRYNAPIKQDNLLIWLKKYNKKSPPLNILFTKRHPHGISLPSSLKNINWKESLENF